MVRSLSIVPLLCCAHRLFVLLRRGFSLLALLYVMLCWLVVLLGLPVACLVGLVLLAVGAFEM